MKLKFDLLWLVIISTVLFVAFTYPIILSKDYIFSNYIGDNAFLISKNYNYGQGIIRSLFVPIQSLVDKVLLYNIGIYLSWLITAIGFYFLFDYILPKSNLKYVLVIIGVLMILFAPVRIRYMQEWWNLATWGWLALYLLQILKGLEHNKLKDFLIAAIFLVLLTIDAFYYGVITVFLSIPIVFWYILFYKKGQYLSRIYKIIIFGLLSLTSFLTLTYLFINFFPNQDSLGTTGLVTLRRDYGDLWAYSARPWHYFIPDIDSILWGDIPVLMHYKIWNLKPYYLTEVFFPKEHTLYLGITTILFALYTLYLAYIKKNILGRYKLFIGVFLSIGLWAFILSMPPYIAVNGIKIYFPSEIIHDYFPQFRAYSRYGVYVYISAVAISLIGIDYLMKRLLFRLRYKYLILFIMMFFILIDLSRKPGNTLISVVPIEPYESYLADKKTGKILEIPTRTDYTDTLYLGINDSQVLNRFHDTPTEVKTIYQSLFSEKFMKPEELWCSDFRNLGGKYIFYHTNELNKEKIAEDFKLTMNVSESLKTAMSESWGYPIWGNHVQKSENDIFIDNRTLEMLTLLMNDPKLKLIKVIPNSEIVASRKNLNISADKFDEIYVFEINEEYCNLK